MSILLFYFLRVRGYNLIFHLGDKGASTKSQKIHTSDEPLDFIPKKRPVKKKNIITGGKTACFIL